MLCETCGVELKDDTKFCPNCGTKVETKVESTELVELENKICPSCGVELEEGVKFCYNCGAAVNGQQKVNNPTKFCQNCGKTIDINAEVCPYCGVRIKASKEKEPVLSLVLSFLLPGLGQIYNGEIQKGIILIVLAIISAALIVVFIGAIFYLIVWVYGLYDAYTQAQKINNGEIII